LAPFSFLMTSVTTVISQTRFRKPLIWRKKRTGLETTQRSLLRSNVLSLDWFKPARIRRRCEKEGSQTRTKTVPWVFRQSGSLCAGLGFRRRRELGALSRSSGDSTYRRRATAIQELRALLVSDEVDSDAGLGGVSNRRQRRCNPRPNGSRGMLVPKELSTWLEPRPRRRRSGGAGCGLYQLRSGQIF
jgi:hypothetical protein